MTSWHTISVNQTARLARAAVKKNICSGATAAATKPSDSTEPIPAFSKYVEKKAFSTNNKTSIIYCTTGEQFPYLKSFENEIGFSFETPALLAAIYITARSSPKTWHLICSREDVANYTPTEDVVEKVNAYFKAAGEPQRDELQEMHTMMETFLDPSANDLKLCKQHFGDTNLHALLFEAATSKFDTSQLNISPRINDSINDNANTTKSNLISTNQTTYEFIFRTFNQKTSWFAKQ